MAASATNPVVRASWRGPSLNQSMTFWDLDVSNNTSLHLSPGFHFRSGLFTGFYICRCWHTSYFCITLYIVWLRFLIKFLYWMPPLTEWNIYISPPGFVPDDLTTYYRTNRSDWRSDNRLLPSILVFFLGEILILYKILIWLLLLRCRHSHES